MTMRKRSCVASRTCSVVPKQVPRGELEILEVDDRLPPLGRCIGDAEALEQLLQELAVVRGQLLECCALGRLARLLERRGTRSLARERREVDEPLGRSTAAEHVEQLARVRALRRRRRGVARERLRLRAQHRDRVARVRSLAELEHEVAAGRAQRLVHARQHPAQAVRAVGREQAKPLRVAVRAELLERAVERLPAENDRARVLELAEPRVEPGGERMRPQQATAEAVDRRDPGAVELAREIRTAALAQRGADPCPQLARGLARVRDHEDRLDVDPALADGPDVPLDEDRGLARAGAGGDEDGAVGLDSARAAPR